MPKPWPSSLDTKCSMSSRQVEDLGFNDLLSGLDKIAQQEKLYFFHVSDPATQVLVRDVLKKGAKFKVLLGDELTGDFWEKLTELDLFAAGDERQGQLVLFAEKIKGDFWERGKKFLESGSFRDECPVFFFFQSKRGSWERCQNVFSLLTFYSFQSFRLRDKGGLTSLLWKLYGNAALDRRKFFAHVNQASEGPCEFLERAQEFTTLGGCVDEFLRNKKDQFQLASLLSKRELKAFFWGLKDFFKEGKLDLMTISFFQGHILKIHPRSKFRPKNLRPNRYEADLLSARKSWQKHENEINYLFSFFQDLEILVKKDEKKAESFISKQIVSFLSLTFFLFIL